MVYNLLKLCSGFKLISTKRTAWYNPYMAFVLRNILFIPFLQGGYGLHDVLGILPFMSSGPSTHATMIVNSTIDRQTCWLADR